ncbi:hypothetical protein [Zafaria cholistanensis]|nr:hypothetical protein [Zafaria cholistanensis]
MLTILASGTASFTVKSVAHLYADGVRIPRTDTVNGCTTLTYNEDGNLTRITVQVGATCTTGMQVNIIGQVYDMTKRTLPILV